MRASVERGLIVPTPFLEDLYERTHETVHLGVREQLDVVYTSKIGGHGFAEVPSRIGQRLPLHCTAIGKMLLANSGEAACAAVFDRGLTPRGPRTITDPATLLAELKTIRESGFSFEFEESTPGLTCIAAPILDQDDQVIAAVSIAGPSYRSYLAITKPPSVLGRRDRHSARTPSGQRSRRVLSRHDTTADVSGPGAVRLGHGVGTGLGVGPPQVAGEELGRRGAGCRCTHDRPRAG